MRTITNSFNSIVDLQKKAGYPFPSLLQSPATLEQINLIEKSLRLRFNNELCELYFLANGTNLYNQDLPLGKMGLIPIHCFLDLSAAEQYYDQLIGISNPKTNDFFYNGETNFKPEEKLFPILDDSGGTCYWVDLNERTPNYSKIFYTNVDGEYPDYVFDNLTSMFATFAECYESSIIFVDREGFLNCHYYEYYKIASKYNPTIKYWKEFIK